MMPFSVKFTDRIRRPMSKKAPRVTTLVVGALAAVSAASAGDKGTAAEAQALLDRAVKLVQTDGEAKALAAFNDPKGGFQDRDLYVFCSGPDNKLSAHRDPKLVGSEIASIKGPDGRTVGKEIQELGKKGGGTLEYKWPNPVSNKVETKVSYIKKAGNQVCGVGAYK
jgi:signal transduction histidine kinase